MLISLINGRIARQQKGKTLALPLSLITNVMDFCFLDSHSDAWELVFAVCICGVTL